MVEGQLQLLLLIGNAEEVVRRLEFAVPDDVQLAAELEPERLVEAATPLRVRDAEHRVEVARHRFAPVPLRNSSNATSHARLGEPRCGDPAALRHVAGDEAD